MTLEKLICCFRDDKDWVNFDLSTRNPQNFYFDWFLLCKAYHFCSKKSTEKLSFIKRKRDARWEEKLTCGLENDMRNIALFHQSTWKSQDWDFDGILLSKVENV